MGDLETIRVVVSLAFNFIPRKVTIYARLPFSQFRDSATQTLTPGDGKTALNLESSA